MSLSGRTPACPRQRGRTLFPSARGAYQPTRSSNGAISRRDGGRELACPVLIARVGQEPCVGPPATPPISPTQPSDGGRRPGAASLCRCFRRLGGLTLQLDHDQI